MIRLIIAGSREFDDYQLLKAAWIDKFSPGLEVMADTEIISGGARGADRLGEELARNYGIKLTRFPADWSSFGKRAGVVRNQQMADYASESGHLGYLLAFWDGTSRGTRNMIDLANKRGLDVTVIRYDLLEKES